MALLDPTAPPRAPRGLPGPGERERAARRALGAQVARLERELADALVSAFDRGGLNDDTGGAHRGTDAAGHAGRGAATVAGGPRMLALGELEALRDDLLAQVRAARVELEARGREQERHRIRLERMLLAPGEHRFERVSHRQLGERGCGVWQVRPRLGLIGLLAGWWHVKLSSGCPLATARR